MARTAGVDFRRSYGSEKMESGSRNKQDRQKQTGFVEARNL
jgi:hypothetical protein